MTQVADNAEYGYVLEVDLEYSKELHELHSDYPLAPERMQIAYDMLSEWQLDTKTDLGYKQAKVEKLVPNLKDKYNYVIHYRNLKFHLERGLKLRKIHRALTFKQSPWLKSYIELNTRLRAAASNEFEKDFFKLMNNSVFGKTMEDVRNRIKVKLVTEPEIFRKQASKINYKASKVFINDEEKGEYFAAVDVTKSSIALDKPMYTGFSVLELSKLHMFDFHYNYMMRKCGPEKAKLLFTHTDSLSYQVLTPDLYTDVLQEQDLFDTSNYPKEHPLFSRKNNKVIGKFKDEMGGTPVVALVGLRAKNYAILTDDGA